MRISVIIPAINEEANISQAVHSAWEAGADEVIVVDGGSRDTTRDQAQQAKAVVIRAKPGRAHQQNVAAAQAGGDVLVFLHADNRLQAAALAPLRNQPTPKLGAFRQRIDAKGWAFRLLEWGNDLRARLLGLPYGDQTLFIEAQFFRQIGGFPAVPLMEDYLLLRKLRWQTWPRILRTVTTTSSRRWQKRGLLRQTLLNWSLIVRYEFGVPVERLASLYRRHDEAPSQLQETHADR